MPYFLCRSAKPIAALLVAAKAQIVCEKVFFTRFSFTVNKKRPPRDGEKISVPRGADVEIIVLRRFFGGVDFYGDLLFEAVPAG